jgi:5-hydroxyisourate hydrolase
MATLSTHTLNSVDGRHAAAVGIALLKIATGGERIAVFDSRTDSGGRLSQLIEPAMVDTAADYELVFQTGAYFEKLGLKLPGLRIQKEVVIRFCMPDPLGAYHMPLVMAPNGYSVWLSS